MRDSWASLAMLPNPAPRRELPAFRWRPLQGRRRVVVAAAASLVLVFLGALGVDLSFARPGCPLRVGQGVVPEWPSWQVVMQSTVEVSISRGVPLLGRVARCQGPHWCRPCRFGGGCAGGVAADWGVLVAVVSPECRWLTPDGRKNSDERLLPRWLSSIRHTTSGGDPRIRRQWRVVLSGGAR